MYNSTRGEVWGITKTIGEGLTLQINRPTCSILFLLAYLLTLWHNKP